MVRTRKESEEMETDGDSGGIEEKISILKRLYIVIRTRLSNCQRGLRSQGTAAFIRRLLHCEKRLVESWPQAHVSIGQ